MEHHVQLKAWSYLALVSHLTLCEQRKVQICVDAIPYRVGTRDQKHHSETSHFSVDKKNCLVRERVTKKMIYIWWQCCEGTPS